MTIQQLIDKNLSLPAGLTQTGDLDLTGYAHALPAGLINRVKNDLFEILTVSVAQVPDLLIAIRTGKINGSTYEGECRCLVGTLEKAGKGKLSLPHRAERPAERWFVPISKGDTPATNRNAKMAKEWVEEFLAAQNAQN